MNRKLIITKHEDKIITSLLENEEIVELHCYDDSIPSDIQLGDIYIGRVKNIVKNIDAAFIEVTKGVECYFPMEESAQAIFTRKIGKKPLCIGDELLVQVSREAVKTKAASVTSKLNFTSKYVVLTVGDTRISVSSKLCHEDRVRLKELAKPFCSEEYGFIIRTNAKDLTEDELRNEIQKVIWEYQLLSERSKTRVCYSCMKHSPKTYLADLKNIYQDGLTDILVEDDDIYEEVSGYLQTMQPEDSDKLRHYQDPLLSLDKLYNIEKTIERALKEYVWLKSGAYLVIQPTEALTVIDVNTGKAIGKKNSQEHIFHVNLEAAKEAAKQIRLRNLSGIILVDFINLSNKEDTKQLLDFFEKQLKQDPIVTTLVDVTKLHLVEVTRKKVRKPLMESI